MSIIESLLFITGDSLAIEDFKKLTGATEDGIRDAIYSLMSQYRARNGGIILVELAGGYQMVSNPAYAHWIKGLKKNKTSTRLSLAALETLAIIAYKQPITRVEIEEIRSVSADWTIKLLFEKRLIKIVGRKDAPGRPLLLGTTKEFLQYFGLKELYELPTLKEFTRHE
ncbi:MAG: SMC-Scp complex subunit ScpB [Nitrospirae bacterium]|nr:SMC-Scp complex subunit ScpB [Nitrospirota bacterium]